MISSLRSPRRWLRPVLWCVFFLPLLPLRVPAGGHRMDPNITIRFFTQTNTFDTSFATKVEVGNPPREVIIEKIPSISERDIASFYPFQAPDGTYAVAFQLDRHGQIILEALSSSKRGSLLIAAINGRIISPMLVDKIITDGIIYVPSGITQPELRAMGSSFLITGRDRVGPNKKPKSPEDSNPLAPR